MEPRLYRIGEFAKRARVSIRTLRFYEREGLLSPSDYSESGHRRYSDADLVLLGRILGLKMFGFTLAEIRAILRAEPESVGDALVRQRTLLEERQRQIRQTIRTLIDVEAEVRSGTWDWDSIARVVEVMNMNEDKECAHKHLTPAQLQAVREISERAYSAEAYNELRDRTWSEDDQRKASAEWSDVYAEAARLAGAGADPAGPEGLALGRRYKSLIDIFTMGNAEIAAGLERFYSEAKELPPDKSPYNDETWETMNFAERAYRAASEEGA